MIIVMKTHSPDSTHNSNYDYAIFKMEAIEARLLMQKFNVFKLNKASDPILTDMLFNVRDCSELTCEFYSCDIWDDDENDRDIMPTKVREDLDKQGWSIIDSIHDLKKDITPRGALSPELIFLNIYTLGWFWRARPRAGSPHVETQLLPFELLQQVL